ncbi:MAG: Eco57I restriction-modification methylase domain-containing protein [Candidatus Hermodarchaeota archaeon]
MSLQKEGIVYTPESITNFIAKTTIDHFLVENLSSKFGIKNTNLDKLFEKYIQDNTKNQFLVESSFVKQDKEQFKYIFILLKNLSILDPSVGNGELLIAALNVLESYFIRLKTLKLIEWSHYQIRKFILSNILYGVDIESEAINITKQRVLSLLTELSDEFNNFINLTNIDSNFRLGNALVGFVRKPEINIPVQTNITNVFYDKIKNVFQTHKDLRRKDLSESEKKKMVNKLKPFHWFLEFPDIMLNGGFDIILQNPPYISNRQLSPLEKAIFEDRYKTPKGLMNTFGMFIERSIDLCHCSSRISNIVHKNLIRSNNYYSLRKFLLKSTTIDEIIDLGAGIFQFVTAETIVIILKPEPPPENHKILIKNRFPNQKFFTPEGLVQKEILQNIFLEQENYNINLNLGYKELEIINFIKRTKNCDLSKFFEAKTCIATGDDERFLKENKISEKYKKTLRGKDIGRYYIDFNNLYIYYSQKILHRARDENIFLKPEKLIMQTISSSLTVAYDDQNYYPLSTCIVIIPRDRIEKEITIKYLLLFMNSKLINFYYDFVFNLGAHLTTEISVSNINKLPLILPEKYEIFNLISDMMVQLNKSKLIREENKDIINFFYDLIDCLIYELAFNHNLKFNTNLINQISQYLTVGDVNSMGNIQEHILNIQNDDDINRDMIFIKNHQWVKIIDNYLRK